VVVAPDRTAPGAAGDRAESLAGLGTLLRHLLDQMDGDIAAVLADLGTPGYRPRFSPVVRALVALGPVPIRDLARAIAVSHSAASQTVAQMAGRGFVVLRQGEDARQRVVHLTPKTVSLLPAIEAEWAATASAAAEMDAELPFPLAGLVPAIAAALDRRSFRQRMTESAWAAGHPEFGEALAAARRRR
jgi:DNA-binding MarR family transcriptional regulator